MFFSTIVSYPKSHSLLPYIINSHSIQIPNKRGKKEFSTNIDDQSRLQREPHHFQSSKDFGKSEVMYMQRIEEMQTTYQWFINLILNIQCTAIPCWYWWGGQRFPDYYNILDMSIQRNSVMKLRFNSDYFHH